MSNLPYRLPRDFETAGGGSLGTHKITPPSNDIEHNRIIGITGKCRNSLSDYCKVREYEVLTQRGLCWIRELPIVGAYI